MASRTIIKYRGRDYHLICIVGDVAHLRMVGASFRSKGIKVPVEALGLGGEGAY